MKRQMQPSRPAVRVTRTPQSSWIRGVAYHDGILIILTGEGRGRKVTGALLYSGVPSWVVGLLIAARAKSKTGGEGRKKGKENRTAGQESIGATYFRLVKGKYRSQTVGPDKVGELLKLIGG